jgi:hypothetical protein
MRREVPIDIAGPKGGDKALHVLTAAFSRTRPDSKISFKPCADVSFSLRWVKVFLRKQPVKMETERAFENSLLEGNSEM